MDGLGGGGASSRRKQLCPARVSESSGSEDASMSSEEKIRGPSGTEESNLAVGQEEGSVSTRRKYAVSIKEHVFF